MIDMPAPRHSNENHATAMTFQQRALIWLLFLLICLGLGYPPLNRYDPGKVIGTSDAAVYRDIVTGALPAPGSAATSVFERLAEVENQYRLLVPYVARPFYRLARGRVGTWDAALLGLLVANAIFTATTACLLVAIGLRLRLNRATALLGATLYLLNFCVANLYLAGLVDSAEGCIFMAIAWSLLTGRWFLLPLWGIFGALAKETFVPVSALFVCGWWISEVRRDHLHLRRLGWMAAFGVASMATVTLAVSAVAGVRVWPWQLAAYMHAHHGFLTGLRGCLLSRDFWYILVWLLPLGLIRMRRLPRPWIVATALACAGALTLGAYHSAGGNVARPLFSVAGPLLSLSTALFFSGANGAGDAGPNLPPVIIDGATNG
jgi:hypothetical protein